MYIYIYIYKGMHDSNWRFHILNLGFKEQHLLHSYMMHISRKMMAIPYNIHRQCSYIKHVNGCTVQIYQFTCSHMKYSYVHNIHSKL